LSISQDQFCNFAIEFWQDSISHILCSNEVSMDND
jgi:hypothetical protein